MRPLFSPCQRELAFSVPTRTGLQPIYALLAMVLVESATSVIVVSLSYSSHKRKALDLRALRIKNSFRQQIDSLHWRKGILTASAKDCKKWMTVIGNCQWLGQDRAELLCCCCDGRSCSGVCVCVNQSSCPDGTRWGTTWFSRHSV